MASSLQEKIRARNRRQSSHAHELHGRAVLHRFVRRLGAERKIEQSQEVLRRQVSTSKRMALRAKAKAIRARERARRERQCQ